MVKQFDMDIKSFPKELNLLLSLARNENDRNVIANSLTEINWNYFTELAKHHRVYPTVYTNVKRWNVDIPVDVRNELSLNYRKNTFQMLRLSAEVDYVCRIFDRANIRTLLLKGPILAESLYGDISLRTSKDIDILISMDQVEEAEILLNNSGYILTKNIPRLFNDWKRKVHHLSYLHPEKGIQVEMHWRLNPDTGKEPGFEELWGRRRSSSLSGNKVNYLGLEDLFYYLVCHGARHGWFRLRWLADIDRLVRQPLEWQKSISLLRKYHSISIGGQALILTSRLFHTPVTREMEIMTLHNKSLKLARNSIIFFQDIVALSPQPTPEIANHYKRYLFSLKTNWQKCTFVINRFYPNSWDAAALPLPKFLHFLYFPLRPVLWFWRRAKQQAQS